MEGARQSRHKGPGSVLGTIVNKEAAARKLSTRHMKSMVKAAFRGTGAKPAVPKDLTGAQRTVLATVLQTGEATFGPTQIRPVKALERAGLVVVRWSVRGDVTKGRQRVVATLSPAAFDTDTDANRGSVSWHSLLALAGAVEPQALMGEG